ncbi:MAG TPA: SEC-C metal-binding domain-containing protein, partial [Gammaproteobacteria bacterium]
VVRILSRIHIGREEDLSAVRKPAEPKNMRFSHPQAQNVLHPEDARGEAGQGDSANRVQPYVRGQKKIGRNDPCFCGSGKKFKHCHGQLS